MNLVDWVIVGMAVACGWIGFRRGLVTSLLSFAGFVGGAIAGALMIPGVVARFVQVSAARPVTVVIGIIVAGFLGQFIARIVGRRLRASVRWQSARLLDSIGGAAVTVSALALTVWIVSSALAALPANPVTSQVRTSQILVLLDSAAPTPARDALVRLRQVASGSAMPQLFASVAELTGNDVGPPSSETLDIAALAALRPSVVRVHGNAKECARSSSATGFIIDPDLVLTNAHVVAGVRNVSVRGREKTQPATIVYFDRAQDIAVLRVPGITGPAMTVVSRAPDIGVDVAAVGYPEDGPLVAVPLRVRGNVDAVGDDIYGSSSVNRTLVALQGPRLQPGISGSPIVDERGDVVAMVVGASTGQPGVSYAIPAFVLQSAARAARDAQEPIAQTPCIE